MEPGQSRQAAGRARALTAKTVLGAGAVGAFGLCAVLARSSHAAGAANGSGGGTLTTPSSFRASLQQGSDDDFGSGQIAPSTGPPQASTGTS